MLKNKLHTYKVMRGRIWIVWVLSCLCVLLVPLGIGIIIYNQSIKVGIELAYDSNGHLAKMLQNQIDYEIDSIYANLKRLSVNNNVQKIADLKGNLQAEDQYNIYLLNKELSGIIYSEELVDDVFVYFGSLDKVVSFGGNVNLETYYKMHFKDTNISYDRFKEYILGYPSKQVLTVLNQAKDDYMLFTTSNLQFVKGYSTATIGIRISREKLSRLLQSVSEDTGYHIMVMDGQGSMFYENDEIGVPLNLIHEQIESGRKLSYEIGGKKYIGAVTKSQYCDLYYVISMPTELVEGTISDIRRYAVAGLFICLILGGIIVCAVAKLNYSPVQKLLSLFKDKGKVEYSREEGEYKWLMEQTEVFFREHKNAQHELNKNQRTLKYHYMLQLLESTYEGRKYPLKRMEGLTIELKENIVVLFKINVQSRKQAIDELKEFIIANITEEIVGEYFRLEVLEMNQYVTAVVEIPQIQEDFLALLKELVESVEAKFEELFKLPLNAYVGGAHRGEDGIHQSYMEAKQALFYEDLLDSHTIYYDDIRNENKKYDYSSDAETRIVNAVRVADGELACRYINEVIENNLRCKRISTEMRSCLLADILGTIIKCTDDLGCGELPGSDEWYHKIREADSIGDMKLEFEQIIMSICTNLHRVDKNEDKELCGKIDGYILQNFTNPDLNISQIGLYLNLTPAYVSTIYKRQTGKGLLKYINTLRIECAHELLEKGYTVMEVAEQVGFRDRSSFIRVFKQYTGVTPGQLKQPYLPVE